MLEQVHQGVLVCFRLLLWCLILMFGHNACLYRHQLQEEDLKLMLTTTDAITTRYTTARAYFQCTQYDAAGTAAPVKCSTGNVKQCAQNGTVGCTLHYRDINVTSTLRPGKTVRLCNKLWKEFVGFDRVAYIKGSALALAAGSGNVGVYTSNVPETEAYALVQVLRAVDPSVTVDWAISTSAVTGCNLDKSLTTPSGCTVSLLWSCLVRVPAQKQWLQRNYQQLRMTIWHDYQDRFECFPELNDHLVTALMSLPRLADLELTVRGGSLLPQLGSLKDMVHFNLHHYCLRGSLPAHLLKSWHAASSISITGGPEYMDAAGSAPCGLSGTLPSRWPGSNPNMTINLSNNQLSGELPEDLLDWGSSIRLHGNHLSGKVPGPGDVINADHIDLSDNLLEVSPSTPSTRLAFGQCSARRDTTT
jgi:hypothetical protein